MGKLNTGNAWKSIAGIHATGERVEKCRRPSLKEERGGIWGDGNNPAGCDGGTAGIILKKHKVAKPLLK